MTFAEFMQRIQILGLQFSAQDMDATESDTYYMVRTDASECPICAVYNATYPQRRMLTNDEVEVAGKLLGLDAMLISDIVNAADDTGSNDPQVERDIRALIGR